MNINPADLAQVLPLLNQAGGPRSDTTAGTATVGELCQGGDAFSLEVDGRKVGAYCLKTVDHIGARVVWIAAAADARTAQGPVTMGVSSRPPHSVHEPS